MTPREISARRSALARASGQEVHLLSGATQEGLPELLRKLMNTVHTARAPA